MRTTWKPLTNKTKRDDLIELTRFFVSGEGDEKRKQKMRKVFFSFVIFGLIGLMCGFELDTTVLSESDISHDHNEEVQKSLRKLISTSHCRKCPLMGVDLGGKDLSSKGLSQANLTGANLTGAYLIGADLSQAYLDGANLIDANLAGANLTGADLTGTDLTGTDLNSAIKCKTIFPWGEDNSGCK